MNFDLKNPIQVYDRDKGDYRDATQVVVSFKGKKGLKAIKRIQDKIYKSFQQTASDTQGKSADSEKKDEKITTDDILLMLEMTGVSESLFDEITLALEEFATISSVKLDKDLQELIDIDDLDNLCNGVMKAFLLPKIIQKMNSMSK